MRSILVFLFALILMILFSASCTRQALTACATDANGNSTCANEATQPPPQLQQTPPPSVPSGQCSLTPSATSVNSPGAQVLLTLTDPSAPAGSQAMINGTPVTLGQSYPVYPQTSSYYTASVETSQGPVMCSTQVSVTGTATPPPPTCTISGPQTVAPGESVALQVTITGQASGLVNGNEQVSSPGGLVTDTPKTQTPGPYPYKVVIYGPGGPGSCSTSVTIQAPPQPGNCTLNGPAMVGLGKPVPLTLTTPNQLAQVEITSSEGQDQIFTTSPTMPAAPTAGTVTYTAKATFSDMSTPATCQATVSVVAPFAAVTSLTQVSPFSGTPGAGWIGEFVNCRAIILKYSPSSWFGGMYEARATVDRTQNVPVAVNFALSANDPSPSSIGSVPAGYQLAFNFAAWQGTSCYPSDGSPGPGYNGSGANVVGAVQYVPANQLAPGTLVLDDIKVSLTSPGTGYQTVGTGVPINYNTSGEPDHLSYSGVVSYMWVPPAP